MARKLTAVYLPSCDGTIAPDLSTTVAISLTGLTVGAHDITIAVTPATYTLFVAFLRVTTTIIGGLASVVLGSTVGGSELLVSTPVATAGDIVGDSATELGTDIDASKAFRAIYLTSQTITLRVTITVATLTAGDLEVTLAGFPF